MSIDPVFDPDVDPVLDELEELDELELELDEPV